MIDMFHHLDRLKLADSNLGQGVLKVVHEGIVIFFW